MNIREFIESEEGRVRTAYQDSKGFWTIGIGICIDRHVPGAGLTDEEINFLLENRLLKLQEELIRHLPWFYQLNAPRRAVLVAMAYQMGVAGLLKFEKAIAAMAKQDWHTAALEMLNSRWAREDSPTRADRAAEMMKEGQWLT